MSVTNNVNLIGNLTKAPVLKKLPSGSQVAETAIAVNKRWKTESGEVQESVTFIDLSFFGKKADNVMKYLKSGSKIAINGELEFNQWTTQEGAKASKHSITVDSFQMLDKNPNTENQSSSTYEEYQEDIPV
jgi:single-strand DNA-binding protein